MKKILALVLAVLLAMTFMTACSPAGDTDDTNGATADQANTDLKVGVILLGDENEGYTYAHIKGIKGAVETLGIAEDQVVWKYSIPEDETCYDTAVDLVEQGCNLIFSNSYGHQSYVQQAASEFSDVTFVSMTGDTAAVSGLANFKNAFTSVYESRYISGVVAGMKIKELIDTNALKDQNFDKDGNVKVGYVGAYPYAEVKSGYTAFFLGIKSVIENVMMEVTFTNSWFDITAEGEAANSLMADGCVIIGQHADSTGAPSAVEAALQKGQVAYSVGYNIDMLEVAPTAALTSATNVWQVYYQYALETAMNGEEIPTDWSKGYADGAVEITPLGKSCAEGTQQKVDEAISAIKDGSLKVFDCTKFTVGGKAVDSCVVDMTGDFDTDDAEDKEAIWDGYFHESELRSAPSFALDIDGITLLN